MKYNILIQLTPILGVYSIYLQKKLNDLGNLKITTLVAHNAKVADLTNKINEYKEYSEKLRNIVDVKTQQMIEQTIKFKQAVHTGNNAISQLNNNGEINSWYWAIGIILFCGTVFVLVFYLKQDSGIPDLMGNLANQTAECIEKSTEISTTKIITSNTNNTQSVLNAMKELFDKNNDYYTQILSSIKIDILELQEKSGSSISEVITKSNIEIQKKASDAYMDHLSSAMANAYKNTPEVIEIVSKTVEEITKSL